MGFLEPVQNMFPGVLCASHGPDGTGVCANTLLQDGMLMCSDKAHLGAQSAEDPAETFLQVASGPRQ